MFNDCSIANSKQNNFLFFIYFAIYYFVNYHNMIIFFNLKKGKNLTENNYSILSISTYVFRNEKEKWEEFRAFFKKRPFTM